MSLPPYVGLTGPNASGKGEVAAWLAQAHGYRCRSLSDVIREEARRRGQPELRSVLVALGNELRGEGGPGALAQRILAELEPPALVDSIRNPAEVAVLRGLPGFVLLGIDAPVGLRFERSVARARAGDSDTLEDFRERESLENSSNPAAQQLGATLRLADRVILNDGSLESLAGRAERALRELAESPPPAPRDRDAD